MSAEISSGIELEENQASSIPGVQTNALPNKTSSPRNLIGCCQSAKETNAYTQLALQSSPMSLFKPLVQQKKENLTSRQNVSIHSIRGFENWRSPERASNTNSSLYRWGNRGQKRLVRPQEDLAAEPALELRLQAPQPCRSQGSSWWLSHFSAVLPVGWYILSPLTTNCLKRTWSFSLSCLFSASKCRQLFTI